MCALRRTGIIAALCVVALVPGSDGIGSRIFENLSAANPGLGID